jgi:hypothetical protein
MTARLIASEERRAIIGARCNGSVSGTLVATSRGARFWLWILAPKCLIHFRRGRRSELKHHYILAISIHRY